MKLVPNEATRAIARTVLLAKKSSPRTLFVAGIVGVGVSTVLACKATLNLEEVLDDHERETKLVANAKDTYSNGDYAKDVAQVYARTGGKIIRLYAPSIIIGSASIGALTGSHVTLTRRNAAVTAAYATLNKGFDEYRDRVKKELGEDKEFDLRHGIDKITDPDSKSNKLIRHIDGEAPLKSPYARFFDEGSKEWQKEPAYNQMFLRAQETYANLMLNSRGHLFLSEVYDMLGLERTPASIVVGWVKGNEGDDYVDFGFRDDNLFISGFEPRILLDFNVDGVVYDLI